MCTGGGGLGRVDDIDNLDIATRVKGAVGRHRVVVAGWVDVFEGGDELTWDPCRRGRIHWSLDGGWGGRISGRRRLARLIVGNWIRDVGPFEIAPGCGCRGRRGRVCRPVRGGMPNGSWAVEELVGG